MVLGFPVMLLLVVGLLTPVPALFPNQGDVQLYMRTGEAVVGGLLPYRDFPLPYPPLALVPMVVPYVAWLPGEPSLDLYHWLFLAWEAGLLVALVWVLGRIGDRLGRHVERPLIILVVLTVLPLAWRFDLFPALLATIALWAALEDRPLASGVAIGLGIMAKLYPVVLVPVLALRWLSFDRLPSLGRFGAAVALTIVLVAIPFLSATGTGMLQVLDYQAERGLELESIGSGVALAAAALGLAPVAVESSFSSMNAVGPAASAWLAIQTGLTSVVFAVVAAIAGRRVVTELRGAGEVHAETLITVAATAILALLVTNKVFSVQYVVWLLPLAALLRGGRWWLAAAATGLSTAIHPVLFADLIAREVLPIAVLNLRNGLLIALLAWLVMDLWRGVARPAGLEPTTFRSAT